MAKVKTLDHLFIHIFKKKCLALTTQIIISMSASPTKSFLNLLFFIYNLISRTQNQAWKMLSKC